MTFLTYRIALPVIWALRDVAIACDNWLYRLERWLDRP